MNRPELLVTDAGYIASLIVIVMLAVFVLRKNRKASGIIFAVMSLVTVLWLGGRIIGFNTPDPYLSRNFFMLEALLMFIPVLNFHLLFSLEETAKKYNKVLISLYALGVLLTAFFFINPDRFLQPSYPNFYFLNYSIPSDLYYVSGIYFLLALACFAIKFVLDYRRVTDPTTKNRMNYLAIGNGLGLVLGGLALSTLYNINTDPMFAFFFILYPLPYAYSLMRYDLFRMRGLAKGVIYFCIGLAATSGIIIGLNWLDALIINNLPGSPFWYLPFISASAVVAIVAFVWARVRKVDILKYEFITVVTHKFRTPLTYIKWSVETLTTNDSAAERARAAEEIRVGVTKLVELTNVLVGLNGQDNNKYLYNLTRENLVSVLSDAITKYGEKSQTKNLMILPRLPEKPAYALLDREHFNMALQALFENAIMYTPKNGTILCAIRENLGDYEIEIADTGIGIPQKELSYVFTKFYRGTQAKTIDTEGMGIGLYSAKEIINRMKGQIRVSSEGEGRGTVFTISFKAA